MKIMAACSTSHPEVLKVITEDKRIHYVTKESFKKERAKGKNIMLSHCEKADVHWVIGIKP